MEVNVKTEIQVGRALFHALFGILVIVFGQIVSMTQHEKIQVALAVGCSLTVLDVGVRLPLYYWLVHKKELKQRNSKIRNGFLWLEDRLLIRTNILREHERGLPTTAAQFTLGVLIPIWIGIPLWAVVPSVAIFAFGDPAARFMGIRWGIKKVWTGGTKTWIGVLGYLDLGALVGLVTVFLQSEYPLYPIYVSVPQLVGAVLMTTAVGAYFESLCEKNGTTFSKIIDDNFVVPFVSAVTFYAIATAGTT